MRCLLLILYDGRNLYRQLASFASELELWKSIDFEYFNMKIALN